MRQLSPCYTRCMYYVIVAVFMLIAPAVSTAIELSLGSADPWLVAAKWFVVWGVGVRLFTAGIKQVTDPSFTAGILGIKSKDALVVIRELGFANVALGAAALCAAVRVEWLLPAALAGAIFYGAAGLGHVSRRPGGTAEAVALVSDLYMAVVCVAAVVLVIMRG